MVWSQSPVFLLRERRLSSASLVTRLRVGLGSLVRLEVEAARARAEQGRREEESS